MNYVSTGINYAILFLVAMFGSVWVFNHVSAWGGIGLGVVVVYVAVWKLFKTIKEKTNEKTVKNS